MVELLSTNPAKLFGLYPRKGTLAVGSDADIVVFDPEKRVTISAATHHSRIDYNLYEGTEVVGSPEVVLLRGNVLVENGELVASPGIGQYVKRAKFGEELAGARRGRRDVSATPSRPTRGLALPRAPPPWVGCRPRRPLASDATERMVANCHAFGRLCNFRQATRASRVRGFVRMTLTGGRRRSRQDGVPRAPGYRSEHGDRARAGRRCCRSRRSSTPGSTGCVRPAESVARQQSTCSPGVGVPLVASSRCQANADDGVVERGVGPASRRRRCSPRPARPAACPTRRGPRAGSGPAATNRVAREEVGDPGRDHQRPRQDPRHRRALARPRTR